MNIKGTKGRGGYSAIVFKDGDLYVAEDDVGTIIEENANAVTTIQSTCDGLTSGRTWQETVKLTGDFEIDASIPLPSYTFLDLEGAYIKLANNSDSGMIHAETGKHHITVFGGILDGNKANQATGWGIVFRYTSDYHAIIGTTIKNIKVHGITFTDIEDFLIHDVRVQDNEGDGIQVFLNCERGTVSNCISVNNDDTGIVVEESTLINVINNVVVGAGSNGIIVFGAPRNNIIGNHSISNSRTFEDRIGIYVTTKDTIKSSNNIVTGNHCYDLQTPKRQAYGLASHGEKNIITDNQLWGNATGWGIVDGTDIEANNIKT
jgi:hypothetical protein